MPSTETCARRRFFTQDPVFTTLLSKRVPSGITLVLTKYSVAITEASYGRFNLTAPEVLSTSKYRVDVGRRHMVGPARGA